MATAKRSLIPENGELLHEENHPMLGYRVFDILADIVQHKQDLGLPAKWNRCYELGKNKHWRQAPKKNVALVTANLLHTHRTRTKNMLTDNNPTFNIRAAGEVDPDKEDLYKTLLKTAEYWWSETEQQKAFEVTVDNGETYGLTVEKMLFNPELEQGIGEAESAIIDPFHIGWWPVKQDNIQKCEAILHYWPMTVREARRRWPNFADRIKSDKEMLEQLSDTRMEIQANMTGKKGLGAYITNFANTVKNVMNLAGGSTKEEGDEILVCEAWVKDYTRIKEGEKEVDKYYGNIRRVTALNGGELVVDDRNNPSINPELDVEQASQTYLWDKFPFIKAHSVTDTGQPWGMSDFEQLENLNIEVNKTISQFTYVKDKVSRIKLINPKDTGVTNKQLGNADGIINPASSFVAQTIRYLDPPKIDMHLIEALNVYKEFFFLVAGSFDLEQADTGKSVIAYKAIAALLERAATMLRGKLRNYSGLIRERGRMYLSLMQSWYTEDRFISYEQDGEDITKKIKGTELIIPGKLSVVSGSTMPISKIQQREEALALFDKGAIDAEELLKTIEWPDWKRVVARMKMGPIGEFLEKISMQGVPPALISAWEEIATLEMKEYEKKLVDGEIPMFGELLVPPEGEDGGPPAEPEVPPEIQAEVRLKEAQARKVDAEIELIMEKINTEKVNQSATVAGVQFDKVKLTQDQAKLIADIKDRDKQRDHEYKISTTKEFGKDKAKTQGAFREQGMKSDNKRK